MSADRGFLASRPRASGVLLHPTSLPGPGGMGRVGAEAHRFVDWLADAGQSFWQILPLVDTDGGGSPYNGLSAVAGNPALIDPRPLIAEGLLTEQEVAEVEAQGDPTRVDFAAVLASSERLLEKAHARLVAVPNHRLHAAVADYRRRHRSWLHDYALFRALRARHGAPWTSWPVPLRRRDPEAIAAARDDLSDEVDRCIVQQALFDGQWSELRRHARRRGIEIIGDIPIFVAHDSADVWAHQELFQLDADGAPTVVSGVPPDYFSETGQRWGNPLFRWEVMRERGYRWWIDRFRRTFEWVDVVRVDHFRGFEAYWEIPADEETAVHGEWKPGPGAAFFRAVAAELGELPLIAEDLGLITEAVDELREELGFPGMRVVQFAFDGNPSNPHLPENYPELTVAYTGTHDNDTILGWWGEASDEERSAARERFQNPDMPIHEAFLEMVFRSDARLVIAPLQDVLGMGAEARMNTPGTSEGNWTWRLREGVPGSASGEWLGQLTAAAQRLPESDGRVTQTGAR